MLELTERVEKTTDDENIFDLLSSEYSVDQLDVRENPNGYAYVQDPTSQTVTVESEGGEINVDEVNAGDVDFESREVIDDVFGDNVMAE